MAGSRNHVTADDGTFTFDLIENMGDAYEACEELFNDLARAEEALRIVAQAGVQTNDRLATRSGVLAAQDYFAPSEGSPER